MKTNSPLIDYAVNDVTETYIRNQWRDKRKSINKYQAASELLASAKLMIIDSNGCDVDSFTEIQLNIRHPYPVMADAHGEFPGIYMHGDYGKHVTVGVLDSNSVWLAAYTNKDLL